MEGEAGGQVATALCVRACAILAPWVAAWQGPAWGSASLEVFVSTLGSSVLKVDCVSSGFSSFYLLILLPRRRARLLLCWERGRDQGGAGGCGGGRGAVRLGCHSVTGSCRANRYQLSG